MTDPSSTPPGRGPRWGLRTLGFLILAMIAMITSQAMGGYTYGSFGSLLFGLLGAGYCSAKGLAGVRERGVRASLTGLTGRRRGPDPR